MQKMLTYLFLVVIVISLVSPIPTASSLSNVEEVLKIYNLSENVYLNLTVQNYNVIRENILRVLELPEESSINIKYTFMRDWKNSYLYLLYGDFYSDIMISDFPNPKLEVKIESPNEDEVENAINILEELLFTKFFKDGDVYVGYAEFDTFGRLYSTLFEEGNYTPLLRWVDPLAIRTLGDVLILDIFSSQDNTVLEVGILKSVNIRENKWRLSGVLATTNPLENITGVKSELYLFFKNIYIFSKPPYNMSGGFNETLDAYMYYIEDPHSIDSPRDFEFELYPYSPIVIINRYFNDTSLDIGDYLEVTLNITVVDIGGPVFNLTVNESMWWKDTGFVFVDGVTSEEFPLLEGGVSRTISYVVQLQNLTSNTIYIPPATASITFLDGLEVTFNSSENILHLGSDTPFLNLYIEPIDDSPPSVSEGFEYQATLVNEGDGEAKTVVFAGFLIGDLEPGKSVTINKTIDFTSLEDISAVINVDVSYLFNNESYSLKSSSFQVFPKLDAYAIFNARTSFSSSNVNDTIAQYRLRITGESEEVRSTVDVYIKLNGGELLNSSIDLTFEDGYYVARDLTIEGTDSLSLDLNVSYQENTVVLMPEISVYSQGKLVFRNGVDYFYNTIDIEVIGLSSFIMAGEEFNFKIRILNSYVEPMYNITLSWFGGDDIEIFPSEVSRSLIEGGSTEEFDYNFTIDEPGNYSLPDFRASYWFLGKFRVDSESLGNITVVSGLMIDVLDRIFTVSRGENVTIDLIVLADYPDIYQEVSIIVNLPDGLKLLNETVDGGVPIKISSKETAVKLVLQASEAGEYTIDNVTVKFAFEGREFSSQLEGDISISVREIVTQTYLIWLIPALVISLAIAVALRKRIYE